MCYFFFDYYYSFFISNVLEMVIFDHFYITKGLKGA